MKILPYKLRQKLVERLHRSYITFDLPALLEMPLVAGETILYNQGLEDIPIQQPIFIVGCHRSGTTVLYEAIAQHPDLVYFTNASNLLPRTPILSNTLCQLLGLNDIVQERFLQDGVTFTALTPNEGIRIWEYHESNRVNYYLDEIHENPQMEQYLKQTIQKHLKYMGGKRFINKNPDNSMRLRYLHKLFPDAYFIHIIRDGRAVCSSILKARALAKEFFGSEHRHATSGIKSQNWEEIRHVWDTDPIVGSGMLWRSTIETIERDRTFIAPNRYLELRYEDFVAHPLAYLRQIAIFCQLPLDRADEQVFQQAASKLDMGGAMMLGESTLMRMK